MSEAERPVCAVGSGALCFASPGNYQRVIARKIYSKRTRLKRRVSGSADVAGSVKTHLKILALPNLTPPS
jgi:hypothetical protein